MYETIRFGELYAVGSRNGLSKPSKVRGTGYKMINMGELFANDRIFDIPMELVPLKDTEKINAKIEAGDLLFARQSLVLEGAGKCSIVIEVSPLTVFESHIIRVRLNEKVNPMFYYYYFRSPQSPMKSIVSQCAQAGIRGSDLQELNVLYPPKSIQDRIASILEQYDVLIENNQKQIKLLEEAAQRLYKEWFVDLRFPGYEGTEIVDGVPSGWKKTVLNEVFSFERGKSYASKELSDSEGVVLVNLKNIQAWGGYKREAEKRFIGKYKESQTVEFGDIVMAVTDMTQERRLVGHVALVPDLGEKATYSMDLIKLIPSKGINSFFLYSSLRYSGIAENISKHANGTNVLHLKPDSIMGLEYIIPSAELMDLFGSMVETICKKVEVLQSQMILLSNARDRLLPKLMSGEIEV